MTTAADGSGIIRPARRPAGRARRRGCRRRAGRHAYGASRYDFEVTLVGRRAARSRSPLHKVL